MKSENFSANKISYMVLAHVQAEDGWGASIQGVGTEPIYILEDSSNDRVIAFVGNDFGTAKVFEGEIVSEVLDAYLDSCNVVAEFNELADENIEKSYFMKFMSSALEGDIAEIADEREVSILNDDETENEEILSESENCYGVWVLTIDDAEISCDLNRNSLTINGAKLDDLASIFDELHGNSNSVAVFLSK